MTNELVRDDIEFLLECLGFARSAYETTEYPDYATKQKQLERLSALETKLRALFNNQPVS